MWAWRVEDFGDIDAMEWKEVDDPSFGIDELLVKVYASGINFAETRMRAGTYTGIERPLTLGLEGAGVVEKVGSNVKNCKVGDKIFFRSRGSHATKCVVKDYHAFLLPNGWSFNDGAAVGVGWLTAWHALHVVANIKNNSKVLIEAIASSVGSAALQIAKSRNCWVIGTASSDDKLQKAKLWGVDEVINYKKEDVFKRVMDLTKDKGVNVGCMTIGTETSDNLIASMANGGKIVMYGSTGGREVKFDLGIGSRNLQLLSMSIDSAENYIEETLISFRKEVLSGFNKGLFKPVIDTILSVNELPKAHQMVSDRTHFGKIILEINKN